MGAPFGLPVTLKVCVVIWYSCSVIAAVRCRAFDGIASIACGISVKVSSGGTGSIYESAYRGESLRI